MDTLNMKGGWILILLLFASAGICRAKTDNSSDLLAMNLTKLSLEELMNIEVTSVSKQPERLSQAAAAVFVITQDDIRRSGVNSIPEALRMVPGLQVARIDASKWAISSRGFNGMFANKLLVMIDGRSVYTPLFSGVFWDAQDTLIADVERIEVIRGPGAALWGANAVNGIINIITKHAKDTQGGLLAMKLGTEENAVGGFRYGGKVSDNTFYRVYTKYLNHDDFVNASGTDRNDEWDVIRGGFRVDSSLSESDELTVQGDLYGGKEGTTYQTAVLQEPYNLNVHSRDGMAGGNLLSRWSHIFSDVSDSSLQLYYDWTKREFNIGAEERHSFDIDFQHHYQWNTRNDLMWGLGYRFTGDSLDAILDASLVPPNREDHLFNAFLQDEITIWEDVLKLTLGSKFEHNDYTGFEIQPNARLLWTPHTRHTVWASVSRAVRTPSRADHDIRLQQYILPPNDPFLPLPLPVSPLVYGSRDFNSEDVIAYELGYRVQAKDWLSFDIASFYNDYDHLRTAEIGLISFDSSPIPHFFLPLTVDNNMNGETYGMELAANIQPANWWSLHPAYTFLQIQLHTNSLSNDVLNYEIERQNPHHQFSLRSSMDLSKVVDFDLWLRYVDNIPQMNVPAYLTLDARLGWKPSETFELSIGVQNLFDDRHQEFGDPQLVRSLASEVERNVYIKGEWRF
ncbi:MAG: TonB-dependent receptor [Candidatus Omnitrophota bacterium]|jgi:iron complex outermembrane receptor protein|nr:MAG: TonB-dependent receptor [Candidatus Omnitrophota bacterium]